RAQLGGESVGQRRQFAIAQRLLPRARDRFDRDSIRMPGRRLGEERSIVVYGNCSRGPDSNAAMAASSRAGISGSAEIGAPGRSSAATSRAPMPRTTDSNGKFASKTSRS
ncbi:hypothetical protein, partial [Nocardia abscessus]|uniref:hypothetical protein n=1 Tax=Nocardia abscessus TaxID=120957 RepID=UPI001D133678